MVRKYAILTLLWAVIVAVLLLLPGDDLPKKELFKGFDKVVHVLLFGILSFLFVSIWEQRSSNIDWRIILISFLVSFVYSTLLEYLQNFIPGRQYDLIDLLANSTGIVLGLTIWRIKNKFSFR